MQRDQRFFAKRESWAVAWIAVAQLLGTSLWFSANSASDALVKLWGLSTSELGWLTSAVQIGFIVGTLSLSLTGLADRYRASSIFVVGAIVGAAFNGLFAIFASGLSDALCYRFAVGVSLAGIYPMGMKLIVSWAPSRTGSALAYLVGMLTLGTALPHGLRAVGADLNWQWVISTSSLLALIAAAMIFALGDGPHLRRKLRDLSKSSDSGVSSSLVKNKREASSVAVVSVLDCYKIPKLRAAALGYFGHMWELYTFWALIPLLLSAALDMQTFTQTDISGLSFAIIAVGALGCIVGGILSTRWGSDRVALVSLAISCSCAMMFAFSWTFLPTLGLLGLFGLWGLTVISDSPQFSALSAQACPSEWVGSALAIQNALGFALTVVSILVSSYLLERFGPSVAVLVLVPGPILGLCGYLPSVRLGKPLT